MPFTSQIKTLEHEAAGLITLWRSHIDKGEEGLVKEDRDKVLALKAKIDDLKKQQADHETMKQLEKDYSEPDTTQRPNKQGPTPPTSTPHVLTRENLAKQLDALEPDITFSALNLGVARTVEKFFVPEVTRPALEQLCDIHNKAFRAYIGTYGKGNGERAAAKILEGLPSALLAQMWTVEDDKGGFLAPPTYSSAIIENRVKPGVMRRLANVQPTSGDLHIPVLRQPTSNADYAITDLTGQWVAEGNRQANETTLGIDNVIIPAHEWQSYWLPLTDKLMRNASANVEAIVSRVIVAAASLAEEIGFWTGTGIGRPLGVNQNTSIGAVNSLNATTLTWAGLRKLHFTLREPYRANATYVMNSLTYGVTILGLTGADLVFQMNRSAVGQGPFTLFGRPIDFVELLPDVAANAFPIYVGDWMEGYTIAEESTLRIIRSDEKFIPQVGFMATLEVGGQVTQAAAIKRQKVAA